MERLVSFGTYAPVPATPEGRMLAEEGQLTATITSRRTGRHVTLRLRCTARADGHPRWPVVPFEDASHVFVSDYDGELVARYLPRAGVLRFEARATPAAQWSVKGLLRYLSGGYPGFLEQAELASAGHWEDVPAPRAVPAAL